MCKEVDTSSSVGVYGIHINLNSHHVTAQSNLSHVGYVPLYTTM